MQRRHLRFVNRNLIYSAVVLLLIGLMYVLQQGSVKASSLIDWTAAGNPIINSSYHTEIGGYPVNQPDCSYQKIATRSKYAGIIGTSQLNGCVVQGKYLQLAHTSDGVYVSFGSDSYFYKFHTDNTGILPYDIVLVPNTDRIGLIMSTLGRKNARVYDNLSFRLSLDTSTLTYRMTNWSDELFSTGDGTSTSGVTINLSNNGRYAVYQDKEDYPGTKPGIVRVDLETGERKQFGIMWYGNYASGTPGPHYAISNDGNTVVGGGINWLSAWSLSEGCVKEPYNTDNRSVNDCPTRTFKSTDYGEVEDPQSRSRTYGLELSDDASELSFVYQFPDGNIFKRISISPAGYEPQTPQLDYLALGDSYSSGEGDTERDKRTNEKYYRPFTDVEEVVGFNQPREKCHISTRSYPYILAKGMSLGDPTNDSSTRWQTVACSGARIYDADETNSEVYEGQNKGKSKPWSEENIPRLRDYDVNVMKASALSEFIPGRHKQIEFVKKYKPEVTSLTIGGNDIGFADKLKDCLGNINTCRIATDGGKADLAKEIRDLYEDLVPFYKKLYEESGNRTKVFVLGYPQFINGSPVASCGLNIGLLDNKEREAIQASVEYLNNVIEQAAEAAGVKYIDIEDGLQGGRLCDEGQSYMTGASAVGGNEIQESFHPNARGNNQIALKVWEEVNHENLLDYDMCPEVEENSCKNEEASKDAITVPAFFKVAEPGYEIEYADDMTSENAVKGNLLKVIRPPYTLSPGSTVEFTLFSDPVDLGRHPVDGDGSINIDLQIPSSVPVGYHTLVADGVTYSGEPIRYEQIVLVQGSNSADIDENDVLDDIQACGPFMVASKADTDLDGIDDACDPLISKEPELYRWRVGFAGRTYRGNPEDENQVYIERNIWSESATGISGDYDPEGDGWAIVGVSHGEQLDGVNSENIGTAIGFEVLGDGTPGTPYEPVVYVHPNTQQCRAYHPTNLGRVQADESRTLSAAEISNDQCSQELPDNNPQEPEPPKNEHPRNTWQYVLNEVKLRLNNFARSIIGLVLIGLHGLKVFLF